MSILNDKEIRKLCLVPTHKLIASNSRRYLYAAINGALYSLEDGKRYDFKPEDYEGLGISAMTPEQSRGYTKDGGIVPGTEDDWGRMIAPFEPGQVRKHYCSEPVGDGTSRCVEKKVISYGTSSMGYDVRLGRKFKIFTNVNSAIIDPLDMPDTAYVDHEGDYVIIPPNSYVLGHTIEYFRMPEDVVAICVGKSTYARAGCAINVTPIEPGFEGQVVIEIANQTPLPMKVYANMGIAQFMFLRGAPCDVSYAKRAGKYQGQIGIRTALV